MGLGTSKINVNDIPYAIQSKHLIRGYLKRSFDKYIATDLIDMCCAYYGTKIIDSIIITNDTENNAIIINYDILKQYLFPNGRASNHYFNEFNNQQRQHLWILLLIKKYEKNKPFVTASQYNNAIFNPSQNDWPWYQYYCIELNRLIRTTHNLPQELLTLKSVLNHFYHFYPHFSFLGGSSSLLSPFWHVFQNDDDDDDDKSTEYNIYLCYSSYIRNWYPLYFYVGGNEDDEEMLEQPTRVQKQLRLIDKCLQLFHGDIYQKFQNECITSVQYGFDIFFIFLLKNKSVNQIHIIVQIFDYLLLFGLGNVILFEIAFISCFKKELLQCNTDEIRKTLKKVSTIEPNHWDFNKILTKVNMMRNVLRKTNPDLLQRIMNHPYHIYKK